MSVNTFRDLTHKDYIWAQSAEFITVTITIPIPDASLVQNLSKDQIDIVFHPKGFSLRLLGTEPAPLRFVTNCLYHSISPKKCELLQPSDQVIILKLSKLEPTIEWTALLNEELLQEDSQAKINKGPSADMISTMLEQHRQKNTQKSKISTNSAASFWGRRNVGIDDIVSKVKRNDSRVESIFILPQRKFDTDAAVKLASALASNTTLKTFYASGHDIGDIGAKAFGCALKQNETLTKLCIGSTKFGDSGLIALCEGLCSNKTLRTLDVDNKGISVEGASALADAIVAQMVLNKNDVHSHEITGLKELLMSRNRLCDAGITIFCDKLTKALTESSDNILVLSHLDISRNKIGPMGALALGKLLKSRCGIGRLNLAGNPDLCRGEDVASFATALKSCIPLKLDLSDCGIRDVGMSELFKNFGLQRIFELNISNNGITSSALLALVEASNYQNLNRFRKLTMSENDFSNDDIMQNFVDVIPHVEFLDVSKCSLTINGACALSCAASITELRLTQNALGDTFIEKLVSMWSSSEKSKSNLQRLDLANNGITAEGAKLICTALMDTSILPSLNLLVLGGNSIGSSGEASAILLMEVRPDLNVMYGENNEQSG